MSIKKIDNDPTEELEKAFGQVLRKARMEKDLSQQDLAYTCGLGRAFISLLERGMRAPSLRTFLILAHSMGVSAVEFLTTVEEALRRHRNSS